MMEPVNKDVKEAVLSAAKFLSVTLAQEKLSPSAEKERGLLAEKFKNLITQLGLQSKLPGGGKAPPRPPKGGIPTPAPAEEAGEELYDDIAGVIADDQDYSPMAPGSEGEIGENYEIMSGDAEPANVAPQGDGVVEEYVAMNDDVQEDYEEPGKQAEQEKQDSAPQDEDYEMPAQEDVAENPPADDLYEGVETPDNTAGEGVVDGDPNRERSTTMNMENLTKDTKPENIEGVIMQGFLSKHRKDGKVYFGSKYQKRYCVVRNHVLYYFKDKKSPKQQGYILLPGYQAAAANKRGREFTLTHPEGHRSFQFESTSKKETEEWIAAIMSAANAPLSIHNTVNLAELRNKQPLGDDDSLSYVDVGQTKTSTTKEMQKTTEDEVYDDTNEELYEVVGSVQSSTPSQPSNQQLPEYEITGPSATSPKPAQPIVDEDYELPGQAPAPAPALPPPRPVKSKPQASQDDNPPAVPPPRPSKPHPPSPKSPAPTPPQLDDTYEIADTPEDTEQAPPPPPPAVEIELEDYEAVDTIQEPLPPPPLPAPVPAAVPVRPPKRKISPPSPDASQTKSRAARGSGARESRDASLEGMACNCGRKITTRGLSACGKSGQLQRIRCPCARRGRFCTEKCKCRRCGNIPGEKKATKSRSCRCGQDTYRRTKSLGFVACVDVKGKRQTKCPCFASGQGCNERCKCYNCENSFGASDRPFKVPEPKKPRPAIVGCRCGEERRLSDPGFVACVDLQGRKGQRKKTRCPCFKAGLACHEYCKCYNCNNNNSNLPNVVEEIPFVPKRLSDEVNLENDSEEFSTHVFGI